MSPIQESYEPTTPQYVPVEDVEDLEKYVPGGYHPVQLDTTIADGRYKIVHKLGCGGFSTIWLCYDQIQRRYVALKIGIGSLNEEVLHEARMLDLLNSNFQAGSKHLKGHGSRFIEVLDSFSVDGPNGHHHCLVSNPSRCSVAEAKHFSTKGWLFPVEVARSISAQLIQATAYMHSQGVAHGDLHLGNVLLSLPDLDEMPIETLYKTFGKPLREPIKRYDNQVNPDHVPPYAVPLGWFGKRCEELTPDESRVTICDFGESWQPVAESRDSLNTPAILAPPENLFADDKERISFPADIWTLACSIYALFAQRDLFEGIWPNGDTTLVENISALGLPPQEWFKRWRARDKFMTEDGQWYIKPPSRRIGVFLPLSERVEEISASRKGDFTDEEKDDLLRMLEGMLAWKPSERITAEELLTSAWMQKWGKPAAAKARP